MARTAFHQATIGGIEFEAHLSPDGPYLSATRDGRGIGGAPLGYASRVSELGSNGGRPAGLWVVKHGSEPRIPVDGFGPSELAAFRVEFGIGGFPEDVVPFRETRAWAGLVAFVRSHPKVAARNGRCETYLKGWHDAARQSAGLKPVSTGHFLPT